MDTTASAQDEAALSEAYRRGVARYLAERRAKLPAFIKDTYGLRGSLKLHRKGIGHDLWRHPANALLTLPRTAGTLGKQAFSGKTAQAISERLEDFTFQLDTDVGRELRWKVMTDFLELPYESPDGRVSNKDALAEAVLAEPPFDTALAELQGALAKRGDGADFWQQLERALIDYSGDRDAAAEMVNNGLSMAGGALFFRRLTPGSGSLAGSMTKAASAKLGPMVLPVGGKLFGMLPAAAQGVAAAASGPAMIVGGAATAGALSAIVAGFGGVIADPIQAALGVHRRRLERLLDGLEATLIAEDKEALVQRERRLSGLLNLLTQAGSSLTRSKT